MKRIEDIENMELNELISAAEKADIKVPENLREGIELRIGQYRRHREHRARYAVAAALTALLSCSLLLGITLSSRSSAMPQDTFDDPALAYAEVQKIFGQISEKMTTGADQAIASGALFTQTTQQVNTILK